MIKQNAVQLLSYFSSFFNMNALIKYSNVREIFPFWHVISNKPLAHIQHLYKVRNINQFEKDLDFLLKYYKPGNINEYNYKNKSSENRFYLSFDDGLSECHNIIAPILLRKGIHATFFVNSGFVNNKALFYKYKASVLVDKIEKNNISKCLIEEVKKETGIIPNKKNILSINFENKDKLDAISNLLDVSFLDYLENNQPYMTLTEIEQLKSQGFTIGAHSVNHPLYSQIPYNNQISQTLDSLNFIAQKFNVENQYFAFPFSDDGVGLEFFDEIFSKNNIKYTFGTAGMKHDVFEQNIQRIPMEKTGMSAKKYLKTMYLSYLAKKYLLSNTVERQKNTVV